VIDANQIEMASTAQAHKLGSMSTGRTDLTQAKGDSPPVLPPLRGTLHIYVAFDWGDEVDLNRARALLPAESHVLPRRRRTPSSIGYRPLPLRSRLTPIGLVLPDVGAIEAPAEVTVFDFAAVSLAMHIAFDLPGTGLSRLAEWLADPEPIVQAARRALEPLHQRILPAIQKPSWQDDLSEEYFVFQLPPGEVPPPPELLTTHSGWLTGLVRLESGLLGAEEIAEAMRLYIRYNPDDLFVPDWAAAVLVDRECDETLQTIEFANLQLLEFRHIDNRLDDSLSIVYRVIHTLAQTRLPIWRSPARSLRVLGELKVEANGLFERTGNVLKLVGDQYLARVYRLVSKRFHLEEWEQSIQRKLDVAEGVYRVVSDQTDTYRAEFLEITVVFLILFEILLALFRH
jgi:hypothetical protein